MASVTSSVAFAMKSSPKLSSKNNSRAQFTNKSSTKTNASRQNQSFVARAKSDAPWTAPKLDPNSPSPIFGGSTGGLLRKAQVRNFAPCQESRVELRVVRDFYAMCLLKYKLYQRERRTIVSSFANTLFWEILVKFGMRIAPFHHRGMIFRRRNPSRSID